MTLNFHKLRLEILQALSEDRSGEISTANLALKLKQDIEITRAVVEKLMDWGEIEQTTIGREMGYIVITSLGRAFLRSQERR